MARAVFAGSNCITASAAGALLQDGLGQLGYTDWQIVKARGVTAESCVTGALDTVAQRIDLNPALGPQLIAILETARAVLLDECVGTDEAVNLIRSTLESQGVVDPDVQTGGPVGGPIDQMAAIQQHVDAGCAIYSTVGYTETGHRIFYVTGNRR